MFLPNHCLKLRYPRVPTQGLTPVQVAKAYGFPQFTGAPPVKIGIVSLGGSWNAADIINAFTYYGLPAPVVTVLGQANAPDPTGADIENVLDILCSAAAYSYCTGQAAQVVVSRQPNTGSAIGDGARALADAGCGAISISWGAPTTDWSVSDRSGTEASFAYATSQRAWITAASGDSSSSDGTGGAAVDYPSCSSNVWAAGGTRLGIANDGSIASEQAWGDGNSNDDGGGGGYDTSQTRPTYQNGVVLSGAGRGVPDGALNADPASGYRILANGSWQVVGGTSAAAPMFAGLFAAIQAAMKQKGVAIPVRPHELLYSLHASCFNDIVLGSNGLPAASGWDAATGNGSPRGQAMLNAFLGGAIVPPAPPPPVTPPSPPAQPTGPTLAQETAILQAVLNGLLPRVPFYAIPYLKLQYQQDAAGLAKLHPNVGLAVSGKLTDDAEAIERLLFER